MTWDIQDKTVLVTGGNSGIGKAAACALAAMGADVVITARDARKGADAAADIAARAGHNVEVLPLDLARLASVRELVQAWGDRPLDVLVNNAGLILSRREVTEDGFEATFQINHLGPFLLTRSLLDAASPARVVNVASVAHKSARRGLDFEDLQFERRRYGGMRAYNASKLCNVYFTRELARRLDPAQTTVNALHPGFVRTNYGRDGDTKLLAVGTRLGAAFARSPERGAESVVYLAASPEVEGVTGGYYFNSQPAKISRAARDDEAARRLWDLSEQMLASMPASPGVD